MPCIKCSQQCTNKYGCCSMHTPHMRKRPIECISSHVRHGPWLTCCVLRCYNPRFCKPGYHLHAYVCILCLHPRSVNTRPTELQVTFVQIAHDRFASHGPTLPDSYYFLPGMTDTNTNTNSLNSCLETFGVPRQLGEWDAAITLGNLPLATAMPARAVAAAPNLQPNQCRSHAAEAAGGHWRDRPLAGVTPPDQLRISRQNPCLSHSLQVITS